ncbi:hypothetical protein GUJ16_13440 [Enterococcus hirae]|nr:hypothetical protein [Enterococcus hirae]
MDDHRWDADHGCYCGQDVDYDDWPAHVRVILAAQRPAAPVGESATAGRPPSGEDPAALPTPTGEGSTSVAPVAVDEVRERVARTICEQAGDDPDELTTVDGETLAPCWTDHLPAADAVLAILPAAIPVPDDWRASEQIKRLADFIMGEVPGEPSQSQGAVDTAIRWMRERLAAPAGDARE